MKAKLPFLFAWRRCCRRFALMRKRAFLRSVDLCCCSFSSHFVLVFPAGRQVLQVLFLPSKMADETVCDLFDSLAINDDRQDDVKRIVPKCRQMCPREEMLFREKNGLLHRLELLDPSPDNWQRYRSVVASTKNSSNGGRGGAFNRRGNQDHLQQQSRSQPESFSPSFFTNSQRAVKSFRRSSSGQELTVAEQLRPSAVLRATVDYLLDDLPKKHLLALTTTTNKETTAFATFYDFAFDRLRAIRQDMVVQRLVDANCHYILERCVHFYAYSHYVWQANACSAKDSSNCKSPSESVHLSSSAFDAHLNSVHLGECLQLLLVYYDHFHDRLWSTRRPVFEAAFLVFNFTFTSTAAYCGPSSEALKRYQRLKGSPLAADLFGHPLMKTARAVLLASLVGNQVRALRLVSQVSSRGKRHHQLFSVIFVVSGSLAVVHLQLLRAIAVACRSPATKLSLESLASEWFCPSPENTSSVASYLELLAKYYGFTVVKSASNVDCFNFNEEKSSDIPPLSRTLLIQERLPVAQWKPPPKLQPQLQHPLGWLANSRLPAVYQRFLS